jgi:signal transduction histidine kinase
METIASGDFRLICGDIKNRIAMRLNHHAQLLTSGSAFFEASDEVTRSDWKDFYERLKIDKNLPGIQGFGYTQVVQKKDLPEHMRNIRKQGFENYRIYPPGDRDMYASVVYLEPFSGRNLRAFGFDMYTEPKQRQALELACDADMAVISGKIQLVQETDKDKQAGTLMAVPVYQQGMPVNTIEQRRTAIKGWVYSPYRMNDLMHGILGRWDELGNNRIRLQIYDDYKSSGSILFDSQSNDSSANQGLSARVVTLPVEFNNKKWILCFTQSNEQSPLFSHEIIGVTLSGFIISLLIFFLSWSYFNTRNQSRQLNIANKKLASSIAELEQFTYLTNHDLQEPLRTITYFTQLIRDDYSGKLDEDGNKHIEFIHDAALRMSNLVKGLFDYSLLGKTRTLGLVDCNKIVDIVLIDLAKYIKESNAQITVGKLPVLYGYETELRLLFQNLITNAIKFHDMGVIPEINISAEIIENEYLFKIKDNGIGINEKHKAKIFTIFQRAVKRKEYEGIGIGLALCNKITELHGGKIWVESKIGAGSVFMFTIPVK